jgi:prephenate dehydratase
MKRIDYVNQKNKRIHHHNYRTSFVFGINNKSGALNSLLEAFCLLEINLVDLVMISKKRRKYLWVNVEGHLKEKKMKIALKLIKRKVTFLKILGSYPHRVQG